MRTRLAALLLEASGHVGALGPILTAAAARCADALSAAAHHVSPIAECPGCGKMAPGIVVEGGGCEACQHAEDVERWNAGIDRAIEYLNVSAAAHKAINVTPYTNRRPMKEPS